MGKCLIHSLCYVLLLSLSFVMKRCSYPHREQTYGMVLPECLHAIFICVTIGQLMQLFVKQLSCKITHHRGFCTMRRLQFLYEVDQRRFGIVGKATRNSRDIYQIVRLKDDELGIDDSFPFARTYQIQLCPLAEHISQIRPVEGS